MISDLSHSPPQSCHIWLTNPQELIQSQAASRVRRVPGEAAPVDSEHPKQMLGYDQLETGCRVDSRCATKHLTSAMPGSLPVTRRQTISKETGLWLSGFPISIRMSSSKSLSDRGHEQPSLSHAQKARRNAGKATHAFSAVHLQASSLDTSKLTVCDALVFCLFPLKKKKQNKKPKKTPRICPSGLAPPPRPSGVSATLLPK